MSKLNVHYPSILHSWLNVHTYIHICTIYTRTYYSPSIHQPISILVVRVYTAQSTISHCAYYTLFFSITLRVHVDFAFSYTHLPQYDQALFSIIIRTPSSSSLSLTNVYQFICRYHLSYNYEYFQQKYLEVPGKVVNRNCWYSCQSMQRN